jgi:hypothetical protein
MGTISGTTHMKAILSSLPGTGKHFVGNELCSSDDSVTQLIHILQFFKIFCFTNPQKKISRGVKSGELEARKYAPLSLSNDQKTSCPESHKHDGRYRVVHRLTGKVCPYEHDAKQCSPS